MGQERQFWEAIRSDFCCAAKRGPDHRGARSPKGNRQTFKGRGGGQSRGAESKETSGRSTRRMTALSPQADFRSCRQMFGGLKR